MMWIWFETYVWPLVPIGMAIGVCNPLYDKRLRNQVFLREAGKGPKSTYFVSY